MKSVVPVAAGILSVGVLIFLYLKRREKRRSDENQTEIIEELEFRVKTQQVPAIVGRNSVILKSIEDKTQTQIRFRDNDDEYKICTIKGTPENVKCAKTFIDEEIAKPFVITEELLVPTSSCGKIEGYSGSVLLEICSQSSAKVWVDPASRKQPSETRRVLITGTEEQVKLAKQLIDEKIKEESNNKTEELKSSELSPSSSLSRIASNPSITTTESPREILLPSPEKLKSVDGQLEVFVSAVHSPSRFWVQLVGPQSTELDFLVDAMTDYYSSKENRELHEIREPYLGQIVAAMLLADNRW
jgi:tudor domain-containing protein 2